MACEECHAQVARMAAHVDEINGLRKAERQEIRDLTERVEYLHKKLEGLLVWAATIQRRGRRSTRG